MQDEISPLQSEGGDEQVSTLKLEGGLKVGEGLLRPRRLQEGDNCDRGGIGGEYLEKTLQTYRVVTCARFGGSSRDSTCKEAGS